jgi:8-oxo-dGTP diphosphatase
MHNSTLCYITRGNDVLMLHRVKKKNDVNQDKWIGIGGKFEADETPDECLLREAKEETGLTLTSWRCRGVVTFLTNEAYDGEFMYLFTCDGFQGQLKQCDEGDLQWIEKEKIYSLPIWEGDKIFLKLLDTNEPFFSLKLVYDGDTLTNAILNNKEIL